MFSLLFRRWYAAVPAFLVAGALTALTYTGVAVKYQSQSTLSMLNSPDASAVAPHLGNPFLSFDGSLTPTADFLARRLSSDQSIADLQARGVTEAPAAKLADNASGPFVTLTLTGTNPAHILASMKIFDDYAAEQLRVMQQDPRSSLATDALIRSAVIVPPQAPVAQSKSKYEAVAAVGAVSMVAAFLSVVGIDTALAKRGAKRPGRTRRLSASTEVAEADGPRTRPQPRVRTRSTVSESTEIESTEIPNADTQDTETQNAETQNAETQTLRVRSTGLDTAEPASRHGDYWDRAPEYVPFDDLSGEDLSDEHLTGEDLAVAERDSGKS